jgi:hypothetical protein
LDNNDSTLVAAINAQNGTHFVVGDLEFTNKTTTSVDATGKGMYQGTITISFII